MQNGDASQSSSEQAKSWHGDAASSSEYTDDSELTGVSQALDSTRLGKPEIGVVDGANGDVEYENLSPNEKTDELRRMFPSAKEYDITYRLKKAKGNFTQALEELLNLASLEEESEQSGDNSLSKGAEGFFEPYTRPRGRRKKGKTQLHRRTSSTPAPLEHRTTNGTLSPLSRWERVQEDVEFIATRTHLSQTKISSLYHKNGVSLPRTIAAICETDNFENPYLSDVLPSILKAHSVELAVDFPTLRPSQLNALIRLSHPSTASAYELAHALTSVALPSRTSQILPHYRPCDPSPIATIPGASAASTQKYPDSTVAALAATRSQAFSQASSAYRLSKSKPLMGGAAAYYSSVGRDASLALRQRLTAEAEAIVNGQSKAGEVDLHGVTVRDAVSIARARVQEWWTKEGIEWAREGKVRGGSLRVITGRGQHSEGGKGRLGPAVGAMLVREGWKVEISQGVIDVVGRARR